MSSSRKKNYEREPLSWEEIADGKRYFSVDDLNRIYDALSIEDDDEKKSLQRLLENATDLYLSRLHGIAEFSDIEGSPHKRQKYLGVFLGDVRRMEERLGNLPPNIRADIEQGYRDTAQRVSSDTGPGDILVSSVNIDNADTRNFIPEHILYELHDLLADFGEAIDAAIENNKAENPSRKGGKKPNMPKHDFCRALNDIPIEFCGDAKLTASN